MFKQQWPAMSPNTNKSLKTKGSRHMLMEIHLRHAHICKTAS